MVMQNLRNILTKIGAFLLPILPSAMAFLLISLSIMVFVIEVQTSFMPVESAIEQTARNWILVMLYSVVAILVGMTLLQIVQDDSLPKNDELARATKKGHENSRRFYAVGVGFWALLWLIMPDLSRGEQLTYIFTLLLGATSYILSKYSKYE